MTYWVAGDGGREGKAPVGWPAYSDDAGRSWLFGNPYEWTEDPVLDYQFEVEQGDEIRLFNKGIFFAPAVMPDGEQIMFSRHAISNQEWGTPFLAIRSTDGGHAWSPPENVKVSFPDDVRPPPSLPIENAAVVTEDGRILVVGYGRRHRRLGGGYITFILESNDRGKSFSLLSKVAVREDSAWGSEGPCEPALAKMPNGDLICIMRTGFDIENYSTWQAASINAYGDMLLARSRDGGKTWEHQRMHGFTGVMPKLWMMSNGVLVLGFGRPGNQLVFSLDEGESWGNELAISDVDIRTTGYLDLIEVTPGRLLVVYDMYNTDARGLWLWEPREVNGLFGRFVTVRRLW